MQTPDITAFELAAALDAYEEQLAIVRRSASPLSVAQLQRRVHQVCANCAGLPQLAGATVAFVLSHHGILADLMRTASGSRGSAAQARMEALQECVRALHRHCRELFVAPHLH